MADRLDCVVVGAGVVGLAIARALAIGGRGVILLEAEAQIGTHSSSRNSEVIHAGIYYSRDSLKAKLCVQGKAMLYDYCAEHGLPHERIGKLIVAATVDEMPQLKEIRMRAAANGVSDLQQLTAEQANELEPRVDCAGALLSPSTGIIDSHAYLYSLQADFEAAGGIVVLNSRVENVESSEGGLTFKVAGEAFECTTLVNAAGLGAVAVGGRHAGDLSPAWPPPTKGGLLRQFLAKGHYFAYEGRSPFKHLIYPLPFDWGLGVHATNDLGGALRFGPDVTWVDEVNYDFDDSRKADFATAIKRYFPALDEDKLVPAYTGIRSKIVGPGEPAGDFVIQGESDHGVRGLVNLFGIESPGLTASLAIGDYVAGMSRSRLTGAASHKT